VTLTPRTRFITKLAAVVAFGCPTSAALTKLEHDKGLVTEREIGDLDLKHQWYPYR
jgi:hypothetical protein